MKKLTVLFAFLFLVTGLFAQIAKDSNVNPIEKEHSISQDEERSPVKRVEIEKESTSILIETDIPDVDVFLNGVYQGRTDLKINNLLPGYYHLELRKPGYETEFAVIRVRRGYDLHYHFRMRRIVGYIRLYDVPDGAKVFVGGSFSTTWATSRGGMRDYLIETAPGHNTVEVKCFGYEKYSRNVNVFAYDTTNIYIDLEPAPFELHNFNCNKESFNPDYKGRLGKCEVSFEVTANGAATVKIENEDGEQVFVKEYDSFRTWEQSFTWDGKSSDGKKLEDGTYNISVEAGKYFFQKQVKIDSAIVFPILTTTNTGLGGVGNVPVAFTENANYIMVHGQGGAVKDLDRVYGDINFGALFNFAKHFEIGVKMDGFPGYLSGSVIQLNTAFKIYDSVDISNTRSDIKLCYGGLIRYGLSTDYLFISKGIDLGNGLGAGGLVGVDFGKMYIGYSCQYAFGAGIGDANLQQFVVNNGICLSFKPISSVKTSLWGSVYLNGCANGGIEFCFMPDSSALVLNVKGEAVYAPAKGLLFNAGIGLSYLF